MVRGVSAWKSVTAGDVKELAAVARVLDVRKKQQQQPQQQQKACVIATQWR